MPRKSERELRKVTWRVYQDQLDDMAELFPGHHVNDIARTLLEKIIWQIKKARREAEKNLPEVNLKEI